jgi:hypothetical protein
VIFYCHKTCAGAKYLGISMLISGAHDAATVTTEANIKTGCTTNKKATAVSFGMFFSRLVATAKTVLA